ncbi:MAG: hypothetical protein ABIG60_04755 [Patescibacteria group bacterium]
MKVVITSIWQYSPKRRVILTKAIFNSYPEKHREEILAVLKKIPKKLKNIINVALTLELGKRQIIVGTETLEQEIFEFIIDWSNKQPMVQINYLPGIGTYRLNFNWRKIKKTSVREIGLSIKAIAEKTILMAINDEKDCLLDTIEAHTEKIAKIKEDHSLLNS